MFKILVSQATNNLSDERAEFLINDRLSFMRFLGLGLVDRVPDARTIWLFREKLTRAGGDQEIVRAVRCHAEAGWLHRHVGSDRRCQPGCGARQRHTDDEKKAIKAGRIPLNWKAKRAKLRHKDRDARWTVKFTKAKPREDGSVPPVDLAIPLFGYQNHVCMDRPCVASPT
jgi:transposase, IS5 family